MRRRFLLLSWLVAISACGEAPEPPSFATVVDTVAGVVHVRHTGRAPILSLEPVLTIGQVGGATQEAAPDEFGRIRSVVADGAGRIFVVDGMVPDIRVFGPDGSFIRNVGRKGSGPGEMEGVHGAVWLGEDTLLVVDYGNARLMRVTAEGEQVGQWPWLRITGSGRLYHQVGPGEVYAYGIRSAGPEGGSQATWIRYTREGPTDSLDVPRQEPPDGSFVICEGGGGLGFYANPYADRLIASPAPGAQRIVGHGSDYRLAFIDPGGDTTRILSRSIEPIPLTDAEWDTVQSGEREFRQNWSGAECEGSIERPAHRPVLREVYFDHDGRLLVEHATAEGSAFDLFDAEGAWLATIPAPERDRSVPPYLRADRLYLATADSLGVQKLNVFRVRGGGGILKRASGPGPLYLVRHEP